MLCLSLLLSLTGPLIPFPTTNHPPPSPPRPSTSPTLNLPPSSPSSSPSGSRRVRRDVAPVEGRDFIAIEGGGHLLPISFETAAQASLSEKHRLVSKTCVPSGAAGRAADRADLDLRREVGFTAARRLRKERLQADVQSKAKSLSQTRSAKVLLLQASRDQKEEEREVRAERARFGKAQNMLLKRVAKRLRSDPRIGRSSGFGQCLRTCASSAAFGLAALGALEEGAGEGAAALPLSATFGGNPGTSFTTTTAVNFEVGEYIAPSADGGTDWQPGEAGVSAPESLLSDYVEYVAQDKRGGGGGVVAGGRGRDLEGLDQLSLGGDTRDSMSYSAGSLNGGELRGGSKGFGGSKDFGSPKGFKVRKPKLKKLGAGFLITSPVALNREESLSVSQAFPSAVPEPLGIRGEGREPGAKKPAIKRKESMLGKKEGEEKRAEERRESGRAEGRQEDREEKVEENGKEQT